MPNQRYNWFEWVLSVLLVAGWLFIIFAPRLQTLLIGATLIVMSLLFGIYTKLDNIQRLLEWRDRSSDNDDENQ